MYNKCDFLTGICCFYELLLFPGLLLLYPGYKLALLNKFIVEILAGEL